MGNMQNGFDIHEALVVVWTANLKLKQEGIAEYKRFLKLVMKTYDLEKNDLFTLLSLCKNKEVMDALMLIAKYSKKDS